MKRFSVVLALLACLSAPARAQGTIVSYEQQVFAPGVNPATGSPIWTNSYAASSLTCGQPKTPAPSSVTNPGRFGFNDPSDASKDCIGTIATGTSGLLNAIPNGVGYSSTMTQTDNLGQVGVRSAASNFFGRQGPPAVLTGFKVLPSVHGVIKRLGPPKWTPRSRRGW